VTVATFYVGTSLDPESDPIPIRGAQRTEATATRIVVESGDFTFEFKGSFFYDGRGTPFGQVSSMSAYIRDKLVESYQKVNVYLSELAGARDNEDLLNLIFQKNDKIIGSRKADELFGFDGNDKIFGNAGRDILSGDEGNDRMDGGRAGDTLNGGFGRDTYIGGVGADRFIFGAAEAAADRIADHNGKTDKIVLSGVDANTTTRPDDAFVFIGGAAFSGVEGELNYVGGVVSGDTNGDRVADFTIVMVNEVVLDRGDFIL
jgi:Ca2+-binding RTX toxin-like protein